MGIDVTPERFTNPTILQQLDVATPIPNLFMTGQDTVLCGVTLCQVRCFRGFWYALCCPHVSIARDVYIQLAGVITAFRMEGFCAAVNIIGQSVWKDMANAFFG